MCTLRAEASAQTSSGLGSTGGTSEAAFGSNTVEKASPVEAVVLYSNDKLTPKQLDTHRFQIMSRRGLRRAHGAETIARTETGGH